MNGEALLPPELVELARKVLDANRAAGRRIAVAESCTGGLVSAALTEIAGSSDVFEAGFVTYSNDAKMKLLGVSEAELRKFIGERLNKLEMPREIIFKDQLPKTLIGKLSKKELREEYQAMKGKKSEPA